MNFSTIIFIIVISLAISQVVDGKIKFRSCGKSKVTSVEFVGSDNRATPTVLRGNTYTAKVTYKAGASHSTLDTIWYAILNGMHVKWDDVQLKGGCAATNGGCPIKRGQFYTYEEPLEVPTTAPPVSLTSIYFC